MVEVDSSILRYSLNDSSLNSRIRSLILIQQLAFIGVRQGKMSYVGGNVRRGRSREQCPFPAFNTLIILVRLRCVAASLKLLTTWCAEYRLR
jgi:hypothetical protein